MIRIKLSTKLGELRWSQADLSRATGIRPNTICELYNECGKSIGIEALDRICEALHCDVAELIEFTPNAERKTVSRTGYKPRTK